MRTPFVILGLAALAAGAFAQQTPITVTGFNHDLIAETGRTGDANTAVGVANSTTTTTDDIYVFYQRGLNGSPTGTGLPDSGRIVSAAHPTAPNITTFQLAGYAASNALLLNGGGTLSGTLTLATPTKLSAISFLASGFNSSINTQYRLNYSDGTFTTSTYTVQDNFNGTGFAIATGRVSRNDSGNASGVPGYQAPTGSDGFINPRLYDNSFAADATRTLTSVTFTNLNTTSRNRVGIFAISGTAAVPEPTTLAALGLGALAVLRRRRKA